MRAATVAALAVCVATSAAPAATHADTKPPRVQALPSSGSAGRAVRLRARAYDDGTELKLEASVSSGTRLIFRWRSPFLRAIPAPRLLYYYVEWKLPRPAPGTYRFCMRAFDRAGNRSGVSCSSVRVT